MIPGSPVTVSRALRDGRHVPDTHEGTFYLVREAGGDFWLARDREDALEGRWDIIAAGYRCTVEE